MEKVIFDLDYESTKTLVTLLFESSDEMYDQTPQGTAVKYLVKEIYKKASGKVADKKGLKSLKPHESWALMEYLKKIDDNIFGMFETNLKRLIISKTHQTLI